MKWKDIIHFLRTERRAQEVVQDRAHALHTVDWVLSLVHVVS